jgi:hypothetical protein
MKWQHPEVALTNVHGYNRDVFINEIELRAEVILYNISLLLYFKALIKVVFIISH